MYIPATNYLGLASFICTISNGNGGTETSQVFVSIVSSPSTPSTPSTPTPPSSGFAVADTYTITMGQVLIVDNPGILENDIAGPNDVLSVIGCNMDGPNTGVFSFDQQGGFVFVPFANFVGVVTFTCTIFNGNGVNEAAQITIDVISPNPSIPTVPSTPSGGSVPTMSPHLIISGSPIEGGQGAQLEGGFFAQLFTLWQELFQGILALVTLR